MGRSVALAPILSGSLTVVPGPSFSLVPSLCP